MFKEQYIFQHIIQIYIIPSAKFPKLINTISKAKYDSRIQQISQKGILTEKYRDL